MLDFDMNSNRKPRGEANLQCNHNEVDIIAGDTSRVAVISGLSTNPVVQSGISITGLSTNPVVQSGIIITKPKDEPGDPASTLEL